MGKTPPLFTGCYTSARGYLLSSAEPRSKGFMHELPSRSVLGNWASGIPWHLCHLGALFPLGTTPHRLLGEGKEVATCSPQGMAKVRVQDSQALDGQRV